MGYMVNSLAELPVNDNINLYVFTINGNFVGGDYEVVKNNFRYLAEKFNKDAAIIEGFDEFFSNDLARQYLDKDLDELWEVLPCLLVTDSHPSSISEDTMRLVIPLRHVETKFESFEIFFRELIRFTQGKNPSFIEKFEDKPDWVTDTLDVVDLKPNLFGFGFNINEFIKKLRRSRA